MAIELEARVEIVYVGDNPDSLVKNPRTFIIVTTSGIEGDKHAGFTKPADVRDKGIPKGVEVRNWRQWSAVEVSELSEIASRLSLPKIDPADLGANIAFSGIRNFSSLPKGTTFTFSEGTILTVEDENLPCIGPGEAIAKHFPGLDPSSFVKAAYGLIGLVGVVHRDGVIRVGDVAKVQVYQPHRTYY